VTEADITVFPPRTVSSDIDDDLEFSLLRQNSIDIQFPDSVLTISYPGPVIQGGSGSFESVAADWKPTGFSSVGTIKLSANGKLWVCFESGDIGQWYVTTVFSIYSTAVYPGPNTFLSPNLFMKVPV